MSHELELAAADSAGGFLRRAARPVAHAAAGACANCATPLRGPWCFACGQSAEDFHRSIFRLVGEVVEGLLHVDGRLWRTLPDLMFRPGRLTRAYLEGHRAPQIPPLRLFLVVLLGIFVIGGVTGNDKVGKITTVSLHSGRGTISTTTTAHTLTGMTPQERAAIRAEIDRGDLTMDGAKVDPKASVWLRGRLGKALDDPERFQLILEAWSERFAFLMLPVAALSLSLLFIFQRQFYLFDHTIFSLHSLSAVGLVLTASMPLRLLIGDWNLILLAPAPVHLFAHMRGVYGVSVVGALVRMALLFVMSASAALLLILGLVAVGLNGMGA